MAKILTEKVSFVNFSKMLLVEGRKHDNYSNDELDLVFSLMAEIERYIHTKQVPTVLSDWYIGITENVEQRKAAHTNKNPLHFESWDCGSDRIARLVEVYMTQFRKTQGDLGGGTNCKFVYCFLVGPAATTK